MKKLILVFVVLALVLGGGLGVVNVALDRTKVKTHTVAGSVREIVVTSDSGDIDLVTADGPVEVQETQHYVLKGPQLERDLTDGVLTLDSDCDGKLLKCYADLRVTVPAGVKLTIEADSGDVDARRIRTRNAHVQTDSGDLLLELTGTPQLVWAHTDSGDVDVVARGARAVDAQTDSGDVSVQGGGAPRRVVARSDSGDVDVDVPSGDYAVEATTDSGDVRVEGITRDDGAPRSIQAKTDSGDVTVRGRAP